MAASMEQTLRMGRALAALGVTGGYSIGGDTYGEIFFAEGVTAPTKEAFDAELARQDAAPERITVERLYFMLEVEEEPGLADAIEALIEQMAAAGNRKPRIYWRDAKVFESDHPLMLQLGQHPSIDKDAAAIRRMCEAAYAKQLAGAA